MVIDWAIHGFHAPIGGIHFGFQSKDDKVKDGLVLSVVWCWRDTQSTLGLCFSFGRTIMDQQFDLDEFNGLGVVHTCQTQHQVAQEQP